MRVRLVFEVEVEAIMPNDALDAASDILSAKLNRDMTVEEIFKEAKILRPYTKKEGVSYGRPPIKNPVTHPIIVNSGSEE